MDGQDAMSNPKAITIAAHTALKFDFMRDIYPGKLPRRYGVFTPSLIR